MTTLVYNPGEAMRLIQTQLRHRGYGVDDVTSEHMLNPTPVAAFKVVGRLTDLESGDPKGSFRATVGADGRFEVTAGVFGRITHEGVDAFHDL